MRDPVKAAELERVLRLTPFSRTEFNECGELQIAAEVNPIEKARKTILRSFAGFGSASTNSEHATGFRACSNRSGTTPAHDWKNYPDNIKFFLKRLQGVVIENKDYREVLLQHDGPETLHFLDPPYVHNTRNMKRGNAAYAFEFSDQDHIEMAKQVERLKGVVIICGYPSDLYNDLFKNWYQVNRKAFADGGNARIECLWINKKPNTLF